MRLLRVERHEAIRNPDAYLFTVASHVIQQHSLRRSQDPTFVDVIDAVSELTSTSSDDPSTRREGDTDRMDAVVRNHLPTNWRGTSGCPLRIQPKGADRF